MKDKIYLCLEGRCEKKANVTVDFKKLLKLAGKNLFENKEFLFGIMQDIHNNAENEMRDAKHSICMNLKNFLIYHKFYPNRPLEGNFIFLLKI